MGFVFQSSSPRFHPFTIVVKVIQDIEILLLVQMSFAKGRKPVSIF